MENLYGTCTSSSHFDRKSSKFRKHHTPPPRHCMHDGTRPGCSWVAGIGGMGGAALKAQCWALSLAIDRSAHVGGAMGGAAACARPRPHGGGLRHGVNQLAAPPFSNLWQWRPLRSMLPHAHRHRSGECRTQIS